jgi:hypothetical protein
MKTNKKIVSMVKKDSKAEMMKDKKMGIKAGSKKDMAMDSKPMAKKPMVLSKGKFPFIVKKK